MTKIEYSNDATRALELAEGSDGRLNVSARSDDRSYYNSRDKELTFSLPFQMQTASAGEYIAYWRNADQNRDLVIGSIGLNAVQASRIKLSVVSGIAAGGNELTPSNLNLSSSKAAPDDSAVMAMEGGSAGSGITGLTEVKVIDFVGVPANGHEEIRLNSRLRLGQNDAISIEYDEGTDGDVWGVIFGYYE